ncbi:MAG: hypothetical protein HRT76_13615 [Halieaceae bacterium]|nr:hypothetical protein [Halieaceae bacterium]
MTTYNDYLTDDEDREEDAAEARRAKLPCTVCGYTDCDNKHHCNEDN